MRDGEVVSLPTAGHRHTVDDVAEHDAVQIHGVGDMRRGRCAVDVKGVHSAVVDEGAYLRWDVDGESAPGAGADAVCVRGVSKGGR